MQKTQRTAGEVRQRPAIHYSGEVGMLPDYASRAGTRYPGDVRIGIAPSQRGQQGCGKYHIADAAGLHNDDAVIHTVLLIQQEAESGAAVPSPVVPAPTAPYCHVCGAAPPDADSR